MMSSKGYCFNSGASAQKDGNSASGRLPFGLMEKFVAMKGNRSGISRWLTVLVGAAAVFLISVSLLHGPGHCLEHSDDSHGPQHECTICALLYHSDCILAPHIDAPVSFETWAILQLQYSHQETHLAVLQLHNRAPPSCIPA